MEMQDKTDPAAPPAHDAGQQQPQQPPPPAYPVQAQPPAPYPTQSYGAAPAPAPYPTQTAWQQPPPPGAPVPAPGQPVQPGQAPPHTTVVVTQPPPTATTFHVTTRGVFTAQPMAMQCPNCSNTITTETHKEIGGAVWVMAGWLCLIGLGFGLCFIGLIPFCIPSLKDTVHTCPVCKFTLGKHNHL